MVSGGKNGDPISQWIPGSDPVRRRCFGRHSSLTLRLLASAMRIFCFIHSSVFSIQGIAMESTWLNYT